MKEELRKIIDDNSTKKGRNFDYVIQFLIFASLTAYVIETFPNNSEQTKKILYWIETISIILFTIEYTLRVYIAEKKWRYLFSFYGIIDFLAILPFFLSLTVDLRSLRAFRIFRVFRAFKIVRYNRALNRFHLVAKLIKEELILFLLVSAIFMFIASAGIYYFENKAQPEIFSSIVHSAWWAIVTLTTVGYGDVYPITTGGKIFTFFILIFGVGIITIPAGLVASALTKAREMEEEALERDFEIQQERKNLKDDM